MKTRIMLTAAIAMMMSVSAMATPFTEFFESYSEDATVWNDGVSGGVAKTAAQSTNKHEPTDDMGLQVNYTTARKYGTQDFNVTDGKYRIQFDSRVTYSTTGETSSQLFFMRWGSYCDATLLYYTDDGQNFDVLRNSTSGWVSTGASLQRDEWVTFRLEWDRDNTSVQSLYMNDSLLYSGNMIAAGSNTVDVDSFFLQLYSSSSVGLQLMQYDNFFFDEGTGAFAIPEPATMAFCLMGIGGVFITRRRK